jgi:Flp pilus assembly protein TadD
MSSAQKPLTALALALAATAGACATGPDGSAAERLTFEAALRPASAAEIEAAERADPLTRANFWSREYNKNPEDVAVAMSFARALREMGSHARAAEIVEKALLLKPDDPGLMMQMGRIQISAGDFEGARQSFTRVTEIEPGRAEAWGALGTAFDKLDWHSRAQAAYQKALEIEPSRTTTLTNYGLSLVLTGELREAEAQLRRAAAQPDASPQVRENLALVLGLQGRFDEMRTISSAYAPDRIVNENVALIRSLIAPSRSWEALADDNGPDADITSSEPALPARVAERPLPQPAPASEAPVIEAATRAEEPAGETPRRLRRTLQP